MNKRLWTFVFFSIFYAAFGELMVFLIGVKPQSIELIAILSFVSAWCADVDSKKKIIKEAKIEVSK